MKLLYTICLSLFVLTVTATPPTIPASNLGAYIIDGGYFNLGWTAGNGAKRIIIAKAGSPVTAVPQNGVNYTENTEFGLGQAIKPGEFVIYDNAFTSFYLTGLTPATQYYFAVYEYNGTGATIEYLTSSYLSGSFSTVSVPTVQATSLAFTGITATSLTVNCAKGDGTRRLILVREGAPVNADPVSQTPYTGNSIFGSGPQAGTGNYSVYNSTGNSVIVTNLKPATQYYFAVYEFNGVGQPVYKTPALTGNVLTRSMPTIAASNVIIAKQDGKELLLNWTSGNGNRRIVVAKKATAVTAKPIDGTTYSANETFGAGTALATGEFVVYDGTGVATYVYGLEANTTYHFRIYEYDGTGSSSLFLTSLSGAVNGNTAVKPTVQASNFIASDIIDTTLALSFTKGNGRARMIVARKDGAVNMTPQDFTVYNGTSDFGYGQLVGDGNYILGVTTENYLTVHKLLANTNYHFAVFELNGFNQPLYGATAAVISVTTLGSLPVKLTGWNAIAKHGMVAMAWETSFESNSSHFNIQRSSDGLYFTNIGKVAAMGNGQLQVEYSFEDYAPIGGKAFYRLQMVDKDGRFDYSSIVTVTITLVKGNIKIYGNPAKDHLFFSFTEEATSGRSEWRIINSQGQIVKNGITGNSNEVNLSHLTAGKYWLQVKTSMQTQTAAFIKL